MPSESFFTSVCGPPIAPNTAVSKDIGIYSQSLTPSYAVKATFKKSSAPPHCLAVSSTHVFAAQENKANVHVYSRLRGNQEALVPFPERIRCLTLAGDVLVLGTAEGRLILWEICTGRQITTPPCHVQPVSCLAVTPYHILSASEDSNINVWSLARLLELDPQSDLEPELVLSNHRGAVTDLVVSPGTNPETSFCISTSKDKTCIIWNYHTGEPLRTLLFSDSLLCTALDPSARAVVVTSEGGAVFLVELFGDKALLGSRSTEPASIVVQVSTPLGTPDAGTGTANCMAVNYDGTCILVGHSCGRILEWGLKENGYPTELANLNASVTNLIFDPLQPEVGPLRAPNIIKPNQSGRYHTVTAQLDGELDGPTAFEQLLNQKGFSNETIEKALLGMTTWSPQSNGDAELRRKNQELQDIVDQQRALQTAAQRRYGDSGQDK